MHSGDHSMVWSGARIFLQAIREGNVQLAHFILVTLGDDAVNASVEIEGVTGRTPLMCAAELNHSSARVCFLQLLLGRGADADRRDAAGRTALSLASQRGYLDAVRLLAHNGAQIDAPDNEGKRPLDYAALEHHGDVLQLLLEVLKQQKKCTLLGSMEELANLQGATCVKTVCGGFPRGLRQLLFKQSVCDLFLTEHVICNPYALEHDEEKQLKGHRNWPRGVFGPSAQLAVPEQVTKNPVCASRARFLPAWMRKGPSCQFDSCFWRSMTTKTVQNCSRFANKSKIHLLVPDEDAENAKIQSSTTEEMPLTERVVQNHFFLEEGRENLFGHERMERKNLRLSGENKPSRHVHVPNTDRNASHLLAKCKQSYIHTSLQTFRLFLRGDSETELQTLVSEDHP